MFHDTRRVTSIVYLSCLATSLVIIFIPLPGTIKLVVLLSLTMTQFCASLWYSLSYIPYGRRTALRMMKSTLGIEDDASTGGGYTNVNIGGIQILGGGSGSGGVAA